MDEKIQNYDNFSSKMPINYPRLREIIVILTGYRHILSSFFHLTWCMLLERETKQHFSGIFSVHDRAW